MPIQQGDIQILASQVLADVPEGGGAATGQQIVDGQSNNLFPDVSELDRVYGDVSLRKVFVGVRTQDTDTYFGAHVIVAEPPQDPDISAVLFSTGDNFDRRLAAAGRIESYLAQGPQSRGLLYGLHIAGQMTVMLIQRVNTPTPVVGDTLVLRKGENTAGQFEQYVRITEVASEVYSFTNPASPTTEFQRQVITLGISDQLRQDFPGFSASESYYDSSVNFTGKTKVYETIVADAARYYGIAPLSAIASFGDFTVQASGIFAQLVPSSRAETPIADARMNQQSVALVSTSDSLVTQSFTMTFTTAQQMFVGGGILPGSLTVGRTGSSIVLNDRGGTLINGDTTVGTIDYSNGVLSLSTNVFGTSPGTYNVTYRPASNPLVVSESIGLPVTQASQRLTWVVALQPTPARGSLQVSYAVGGRWYTLQEDGSGAIRGSDSSLGAGSLNFETGTVTLTLGALPDIDSRVILTYAPEVVVPRAVDLPDLFSGQNRLRLTFGAATSIDPGSVTITWDDGTARTATDNGSGALGGDATGSVYYGAGRIEFSPNVLPAPGTSVTFAMTEANKVQTSVNLFTDSGSSWTGTIPGGPIKPRSLRMSVFGRFPNRVYPGVDEQRDIALMLIDDGSGNLVAGTLTVGTVNYTTGEFSLNKTTSNYATVQPNWQNVTPLGGSGDPSYIRYQGTSTRNVNLTILNGPPVGDVPLPSDPWWVGPQTQAARMEFSGLAGDPLVTVVAFENIGFRASLNQGYVLAPSCRFRIGSTRYVTTAAGEVRVFNGTSQQGDVVGSVVAGDGSITLSSWAPGVSSQIFDFAGSQSPPVAGVNTPLLVDAVTFRTATAPIASEGFTIIGTFENGSTFSVTADENGVISGSGVLGKINYQSGVVELRFGVPGGTTGAPGVLNLSYLGLPGLENAIMRQVRSDSLRYNAVAFDYIPLDASILGLDPVRLPSDGRVPIFRKGTVAVVHHTAEEDPVTVSNGQTINLGRTRLSRVDVVGANGITIEDGFTVNKVAGTITFNDVAGYSQPVIIRHRIEDAALVADAQINGLIRFTRPMTHDYPAGSYVSSALLIGDMRARVSLLFDQATWTNLWSDDLIGSAATGTYDQINYPPEVENLSAVTERWALVFTGSTNFNIIGENFGLIGVGNTASNCEPLNPATGRPYFRLLAAGFGSGWAAGNVIRINTVGALASIWVARVVQQGEPTALDDSFRLLVRGDIDTP